MPADTVEVVVKLTGLGAVQAGMRQFRDAVGVPLEAMATRFRGFAGGIAGTLLAALSVRQVGEQLKQALGSLDQASEVSQKLGMATDELSALDYAATLAESSAEGLHNALKFLAKAVVANSDAFATLGIDLRNSDGQLRPQRELLEELASRFSAMPDGVTKATLALELFGKEGLSMIPMLNAGAEGIREMMDEARTFGMVVAPETAAGANQLNDNLARLSLAVQGIARTALGELIPTLLDLSNRLIAWVKETDAVRKAASALAEVLRFIVFDIQALIVAGRVWFQTWLVQTQQMSQVYLAFGRLLVRVWQQPVEIIRALIAHMKVAVGAAGDLAQSMYLVVQGRFTEAKDRATAAGQALTQSMLTTNKAVIDSLAETGTALKEAIETPLRGAALTFKVFIEEAKRGWQELQEFGASLWSPPELTASAAGAGPIDPDLDPASDPRKRVLRELREAEYELRQRRQAIQDDIARLDSDFAIGEADKYRQRIKLLQDEVALIDEQIERLRERIAVERDAEVRDSLTQGLRGLESERHGIGGQLARAEQAPDPYSVRDQMLATITELENRIGTMAESIARAFSSVIGSAIDGIQQGIEGLVRGTLTWGEALKSISGSILNGVISAISRMFAEWIAKRALMAIKNMMFSTQEGATDAAAKAPGAMMTSISSYGVAAVVGMAAMLTALAAISGAFAKGGRPTAGRPALVGEEGPELFVPDRPGVIIPAGITQRILAAVSAPTEAFYASESGEAGMASFPTTAPAKTQAGNMSLVLVDNRRHAREFLESADGQSLIVDVIRRRRMDIGLKT